MSIQNTHLHHKNYQPPIQRLAMVIRDTLEVAEVTIFIGRENLANQDFNAPVISIEQSGNSEVKGFSETYRRNVEVMEYSHPEKIIFDVNVWANRPCNGRKFCCDYCERKKALSNSGNTRLDYLRQRVCVICTLRQVASIESA